MLSLGADEVVAVDGFSTDGTDEIIRREYPGIRLFQTAYPDRALQMNLGAFEATGEIFLFVHVDMRLPGNVVQLIRSSVLKGAIGGGFKKKYSSSHTILKAYAFFQNEVYLPLTKCLVGTNAMFVKREIFRQMNGFHDIPFLEDLTFSECLKKYGRVDIISQKVQVSARRYIERGIMRQILENVAILFRYACLKEDPVKLHETYVRHKSLADPLEN